MAKKDRLNINIYNSQVVLKGTTTSSSSSSQAQPLSRDPVSSSRTPSPSHHSHTASSRPALPARSLTQSPVAPPAGIDQTTRIDRTYDNSADARPLVPPGQHRMRNQARKRTGLPPRGPLAPRDPLPTVHEQGECSRDAAMRIDFQRLSQDMADLHMGVQGAHARLNGAFDSLRRTDQTVEGLRLGHAALVDRITDDEAEGHAWRDIYDTRIGGMTTSTSARFMDVTGHLTWLHQLFLVVVSAVAVVMVVAGIWMML